MALAIKETSTHYLIEVDQDTLEQGPTILQHDGQPVAVLLSIDDYQAFQEWQAARQQVSYSHQDFEAETAAFEQLKPELMEQYPGRVVAIYQGRVVEVGDSKMDVLARVQEQFGEVPCYIEWVEPEAPRRVRVPSAWVADQ